MKILSNPTGTYCNEELAIRLKELGVEQVSHCFYFNDGDRKGVAYGEIVEMTIETLKMEPLAAAFSTDQLIRMLGSVAVGIAMAEDDSYYFQAHYNDPIDGMMTTKGKTAPDSLAAMVIHLLERKKKSLEEANRWLAAV